MSDCRSYLSFLKRNWNLRDRFRRFAAYRRWDLISITRAFLSREAGAGLVWALVVMIANQKREKDGLSALLVGGHSVLMGFMADCLLGDGRFSLLHTALTTARAVARVAECEVDIVLVDIDMAGDSCLSDVAAIRALRPDIPLLVITATLADGTVTGYLATGVRGYLLKADLHRTLVAAILKLLAGKMVIPLELSTQLVVDRTGALILPERES